MWGLYVQCFWRVLYREIEALCGGYMCNVSGESYMGR